MIVVEGHPIDRELTKERLVDEREAVAAIRKYLPADPTCMNLWTSAEGASQAMDLLAAVEPNSSEIRDLARFVCTSQVALFTWERRPERGQGVRTFEFRAWFELSREPCRACGHRLPSIATKCPVWLTPSSHVQRGDNDVVRCEQ